MNQEKIGPCSASASCKCSDLTSGDTFNGRPADMPESLASLPTRHPSSEGCAIGGEEAHRGLPRAHAGRTTKGSAGGMGGGSGERVLGGRRRAGGTWRGFRDASR